MGTFTSCWRILHLALYYNIIVFLRFWYHCCNRLEFKLAQWFQVEWLSDVYPHFHYSVVELFMYLFVQVTYDALQEYQVVLMTGKECFFKWKFHCEDKTERLIESGPGRIETTIKCSKIYHDGNHQQLEENVHENGDFTLTCHKNCVSTYTSVTQIQRYLKRQRQEAPPSHTPPKEDKTIKHHLHIPPQKTRQSSTTFAHPPKYKTIKHHLRTSPKRQDNQAPPSHIPQKTRQSSTTFAHPPKDKTIKHHLRTSPKRQDNQALQAVVFNSIAYLCKDPKHSARWRLAYLFREIKNKWEKQSKQLILEACDQRNRGWGNEDFKSHICPKETTLS